MFIYGNIKSTSSHVRTIFNINLIPWKYFSHDNPIKKLQCKVDFSFSYMAQYKNDYILYNVKVSIVIYVKVHTLLTSISNMQARIQVSFITNS